MTRSKDSDMAKKTDDQDMAEDKRSYLKKMRKLAEDLSTLRKIHDKQDKKIASYEAKLKKIDERLREL